MLAEFIRKNEIDIALLQEVTNPQCVDINGYNAHFNIGSDRRERAILARKELLLTKIDRVPTGRAIAAEFNGIRIVKVYAPSGTAKRTQRERFFNSELPQILTAHLQTILMGETLTALY
jgi:exonuclease III